jgi:hypothetical protein
LNVIQSFGHVVHTAHTLLHIRAPVGKNTTHIAEELYSLPKHLKENQHKKLSQAMRDSVTRNLKTVNIHGVKSPPLGSLPRILLNALRQVSVLL